MSNNLANSINRLNGYMSSMESQMSTYQSTLDQYQEKIAQYENQIEKYEDQVYRSYDGSANNLSNPDWGKANVSLLRKASSDYADGSSSLAVRGASNPNPRIISNNICKQTSSIPNTMNLTDMTWMWGQFLDHEIDLTTTNSSETANMTTPTVMEDPEEDYPGRTIDFERSNAVVNTDPRQQPNNISAYVDGTNVYGFSADRAYAIRELDGTGKMTTTLADNGEVLLPFNVNGIQNAQPPNTTPEDFFLAGDIRANENIFLTGLHTLFVREHNRLCDEIISANPDLSGQDEIIYQKARKMIIGFMQNITYKEFLPGLLGAQIPYVGYIASTNAGIATEFSTAGYRLGHSMLSSELRDGPDVGDTILLRDAFFSPSYVKQNGVDNLLLGGTVKKMEQIDNFIVDDVRNFLFGSPTVSHLLDLASLNIQRGRDHGIPGYNDVREAYGLSKNTFAEVTSDAGLRAKLESLYDTVDVIDPWVGCLVEDHVSGAAVGELVSAMLVDQFKRLRDGDRFYFEHNPTLDEDEKTEIRNTTLADVIRRNTGLSNIQDDVFHI